MMRRIPALLPALCLALLTGCWDYAEINRQDIVVGMALDVGAEKEHLLSVEIVAFESGSQTGRVLTAEGDNYDECIHNIIRQLGRYPNFSHAKILLFSQEYARRNMGDFLHWAAEDHTFPFGILMAVVEEVTALQLLRTGSDYLPYSLSLASMLHSDQANGKIHANPLYEFYNATVEGDTIVSIPALTLRSDPDAQEEEAEPEGLHSGGEKAAPESAQSDGMQGKRHAYYLGVRLFVNGAPVEEDYF